MKLRKALRLISLGMFVVAVAFVFCAISNPGLGRVFYIGNIRIGADVKRVFYTVYAIVMVALIGISFFVKGKK